MHELDDPIARPREPDERVVDTLAQLAAEVVEAPTPRAALRKLPALREALDAFELELVAAALAEGASYAQIGQDLGRTRQSVHRRFNRLVGADGRAPGDRP